jgi:hypothetical protein
MNQAALVVLAIGQECLARWRKYCEAGWRAYALKHGFDLIVVSEALDRSPRAAARSPSWQKCLVLSQEFARPYSQIVLLDSDVVVNTALAPKITNQVPIDRIGGVISGSHIPEDLRVVMLSRLRRRDYAYEPGLAHWRHDQDTFYWGYGLGHIEAGIVQGGVLVASPAHHSGLLDAVYSTGYEVENRGYEQIPLSHAILSSGHFHPIDTRFNSVFFETAAVYYPELLDKSSPDYDLVARTATRAQFENNFFLHFAYDANFMRFLVE